jgi:predicted permease
VRSVLHGLRRDVGYSATVILTLALTLGATTAMFSIVNGVLLKPLAYRESHQLVALGEVFVELQNQFPVLPVNGRHFDEWRAHSQTFEALAEFLPVSANLTGTGDPIPIALVRASGGLFDVLQVQPLLGRALRLEDETAGAPDVVVIANGLWRTRFGADPSMVGRAVTLDGKPYTVVGVLPPGFQLPETAKLGGPVHLTNTVDAFVPLRLPPGLGWMGDFNNVALGRLSRGVTPEQAHADLDVIQTRIARRVSDEAHQAVTFRASVTPLAEAVTGTARHGLLLLLGAIAAVLLIACSNLANLSLTRTTSRLRDAMIRSALGASRLRLVGDVLLEQLILAGVGGGLGMCVAWGALQMFVRTAPLELPRVNEVAIDAGVFVFGAMAAMAAGLLTGLLPAWLFIRGDVDSCLRAQGRGTTADRDSLRLRGALLTLQVALSVTLLVITAQLGLSLATLMRVDRGFSATNVLAVDVALPASRYEQPPVRIAAYDRVLTNVKGVPGVDAVAWTSMLPLKGEDWTDIVTVEGDTRPEFERPIANYRFVAPDFFRALSMPIRRGRTFDDDDRRPDRPTNPAVVSGATAARAWPGQDPIGKRFLRGSPERPFEVVGVVADARTIALDAPPPLMVYVPYWYRSRASASLVIHTKIDAASLSGAIRRSIGAVDPEIAVGVSRPFQQIVDGALAARRYQMTLFLAFGAIALLIAMVGVYAVTAYGVTRRRREMNIRVALGAQRSAVLGLIVRQGSMPIVGGTIAGAGGAVAVSGLVASLLFGVRARDPLVIGAVTLLVGGVALLSAAGAARQTLSIDPASTLRDE